MEIPTLNIESVPPLPAIIFLLVLALWLVLHNTGKKDTDRNI